MKLSLLGQATTTEGIIEVVNQYFQEGMELYKRDNEVSIWEQYRVRPKKRKWLEGLWKYRVIFADDMWWFGTVV